MRFVPETEITLYLIRHGATALNGEKRYVGRTDEPLTPEAERDTERLGMSVYDCDLVVASPLIRTMHTAELLYPRAQVRPVPQFIETDFGLFEGKNYQELADEPAYQAFIDSNGETAFPEGESRADACARTVEGLYALLEEMKQKQLKRAALVVHGGSIMAMMSEMTGEDYYSFHVPNLQGYEVTIKGKDQKHVLVSYRGIYGRIHTGSHCW